MTPVNALASAKVASVAQRETSDSRVILAEYCRARMRAEIAAHGHGTAKRIADGAGVRSAQVSNVVATPPTRNVGYEMASGLARYWGLTFSALEALATRWDRDGRPTIVVEPRSSSPKSPKTVTGGITAPIAEPTIERESAEIEIDEFGDEVSEARAIARAQHRELYETASDLVRQRFDDERLARGDASGPDFWHRRLLELRRAEKEGRLK